MKLGTQAGYSFEVLDKESEIKNLTPEWEQFLAISDSPEPVFQSPGYFNYLLESSTIDDQPKLLVIKKDNEINGIIPIRLCPIRISFIFGKFNFKTPKELFHGAILLGSIPLLPQTKNNLDLLYEAIALNFPGCEIILHQSVPTDSTFLDYISNSKELKKRYIKNTLYGPRDCHITPLPESFEAYEQKFSKKKRYNLNRQIRLLREACSGILELQPIETPEQIPLLTHAIESIVPKDKRNEFLSAEKYKTLAQSKILLAYVLKSGDEVCALVAGTSANNVFQLPLIITNEKYYELSPGTSMLHLLTEDLIKRGIKRIEMGYGTPKHTHSSSNEISERTPVILARKSVKTLLTFTVHSVARKLERIMKTIHTLLKARQANIALSKLKPSESKI